MTEVSGEKLWKYKGYYQVTGKWYKVSETASGSSDLSLSLCPLQIYWIIIVYCFVVFSHDVAQPVYDSKFNCCTVCNSLSTATVCWKCHAVNNHFEFHRYSIVGVFQPFGSDAFTACSVRAPTVGADQLDTCADVEGQLVVCRQYLFCCNY